eukprot:scaffold29_cov204-Chaetoceros_neogracile.AAC.1
MTYRKKKPKKRNDNNTKTNPISKRNLLADNPTHAEEYNKTIKEMTKSWQSQNENTLIDQPSLNIILQEASKSFPKLESLKNDWFNRDKENLLKLISEKNEAEKKYSLNRNNTLLNLCRIARRTLKKEYFLILLSKRSSRVFWSINHWTMRHCVLHRGINYKIGRLDAFTPTPSNSELLIKA